MGSTFGGTWEDLGGGFFAFVVKRALKQDQIVHLEGKLQFILYFSRECNTIVIVISNPMNSVSILLKAVEWPKWMLLTSNVYIGYKIRVNL